MLRDSELTSARDDREAARTATVPRPLSRLRLMVFLLVVLLCVFARPLLGLVRFAIHSELFSYILIIPVVSAYLVWINRAALPRAFTPAGGLAVLFLILGLVGLAGTMPFAPSHAYLRSDYLTWVTLTFVVLFYSICAFCLGLETLKAVAFPLALLIFFVPFPRFLVDWTEHFLQVSSAWGADWFFTLTGMPFVREGLLFQLPGIRLQVAPECSGIHSTLVLFITSLVAGRLFLTRSSNRALLAVAVIPLGVLRNAFRIWTLGELCVHISPEMIDSPIHRRGGPLFFAISLIPLFLLLFLQRRWELRSKQAAPLAR